MNINNTIQQNIISLLQQCKFKKLIDEYFDDRFLWRIKGTSVLSGTYTDKNVFLEKVINRLNKLLLPGWKMHILNTYVDGNTFIVEMHGEVKTKNQQDYNNDYCWIFKFNNNKVASLTAYYDSLLVNKTLKENE